MIALLARREWGLAFKTPLGWSLLALSLMILAWVFLRVLDRFSGIDAAGGGAGLNLELTHNLCGTAAVLMLLVAPLLAARSLSGEWREGTFELIGASPVAAHHFLFGKLLGLAGLMLLVALLPLALAATLIGAAPVDLGMMVAAVLGLWLTCVLFAAAGLFAATLTSQPALAALIAYALLVGLSQLGRADALVAQSVSWLDWLLWSQHLFWFLAGVVRLADLAYFALLIGLFLALAQRFLVNRRL
jgi:ABC-2 type transport system permease protein